MQDSRAGAFVPKFNNRPRIDGIGSLAAKVFFPETRHRDNPARAAFRGDSDENIHETGESPAIPAALNSISRQLMIILTIYHIFISELRKTVNA
jgi:hypothetical protein